jgi:hypothetical protein
MGVLCVSEIDEMESNHKPAKTTNKTTITQSYVIRASAPMRRVTMGQRRAEEVESREQRAESREQRAESREQKTESREQGA